ncbi:Phd finger protein, partial [Thalictrum thalictroides]
MKVPNGVLRKAEDKGSAQEQRGGSGRDSKALCWHLEDMIEANSSGDHLLGKSSATSPQLQLGAVARVGPPIKMPDQKVEGAPVIGVSQIAPLDLRDRKSNHPVSQTVYGNLQAVQHPLQGLNFVQASATNTNHNEIAKSVQKFLHPRLPQHPNWTPPSTDYMNKSLTCQICKLSITDVESVLVCDACERGAHIKCLQSFSQKGIPKGEWHCPNCLIQSNGKPLPPKYGRVTRNNPAPNVPPNAAAVQASAEKKAESLDQK